MRTVFVKRSWWQRNRPSTGGEWAVLFSIPAVVLLAIVPIAAYFTHVINCINHALWFLLVIGCIAFPIGIIHGIAVWFGWAI